MIQLVFVTILFLCSTCAKADYLGVIKDTNNYSIELVQVVHRHGARSPIASYNKTSICGLTYPCGILNKEGQRMTENLGVFIRNRYNSNVTGAPPFFTSNEYNLTRVWSRSTDIQRTLQSSAGLLRGIFPNMTEFFPVIHTVPFDTDWLLNSGAIPEIHARHSFGRSRRNSACAEMIETLPVDMYSVAAEVHSEQFCQEGGNVTCALQLCDIGQAYKAIGVLSRYPKLERNLKEICRVVVCTNHYYFNYTPSIGSFGQILAQELIHNIRVHISNPSYKLIEYSGHDTTITPLAATLGNMTDLMLDPPFASALFFELLKAENKYFIRILFGYPNTELDFALRPFNFHCLNDMKVYIASNNICPLEDFIAFIDSTKPTNPRGLCIVDETLVPPGYCLDAAHSNSSFCVAYRKTCLVGAVEGTRNSCKYTTFTWVVITGVTVSGISFMMVFRNRRRKKRILFESRAP